MKLPNRTKCEPAAWTQSLCSTVTPVMLVLLFQPLQRIENEVDIVGEQLPVGGGFSYAHHHHHHHHPASTLPPSTPLQFLSHHDPLSQELFTVVNTLFKSQIFLDHDDRC